MSKLLLLRKKIEATHKIKSIVLSVNIISLQKAKIALNELALKAKYLDAAKSMVHKVMALISPRYQHSLCALRHKPLREVVFIFGLQKGLVGGLQSTCIAHIQGFLTQNKAKALHIFALGKRMYSMLQSVLTQSHPHVTMQEITLENLHSHLKQQYQDFIQHREHKITLIYPYFLKISACITKVETFLPLRAPDVLALPQYDPIPARQTQQMLTTALTIFLDAQIDFCLAHRNASEYSTRYCVAHAATQACEEKIKVQQRLYNKTRQYKITQELTEASSGNLAYDDQ